MTENRQDMSIGELADATGVSEHTLRYYEDKGLIPRVTRDAAGHRRYQELHVRWVALLERLKTSGMTIARMREYVELAVQGDQTAAERRVLLEQHEQAIRRRVTELEQCRRIVRAKIDLYGGRLDDPKVVWDLVEEARRQRVGAAVHGLRGPES